MTKEELIAKMAASAGITKVAAGTALRCGCWPEPYPAFAANTGARPSAATSSPNFTPPPSALSYGT